MSKAFTSEETPDEGPVQRAAPRLRPGEVRYATPEGFAALRAARDAVQAERAEAAALPEPGRAARFADLDARAARLDATLGALTVLSPDAAPEGEVAFGTWVTVEDDAGTRTTWRLVGPDEVAPRRGLISVHSPVARALLGRTAGEEAEVPRPGADGPRRLTVVAVVRRPPA